MFIESPMTSIAELRRSGTWTMGAHSSELKDVAGKETLERGIAGLKDGSGFVNFLTPNPELPTCSRGDRGEDAVTTTILTSSLLSSSNS